MVFVYYAVNPALRGTARPYGWGQYAVIDDESGKLLKVNPPLYLRGIEFMGFRIAGDKFVVGAEQAFLAEVPELPGCMADGKTYQEALANAEVIIQEWLETAQELGRPIPRPKGRLLYA